MPESSIEDVSVTLRFLVGSASRTLGELAVVQSGYIFETDSDVELPVAIEINGAIIGHGELVNVGGKIGVRVKEYSGHDRTA